MDSLVCCFFCDWFCDLFYVIKVMISLVTNRVKATIYALGLSSICIINKFKIVTVDNEYIKYFINCYLNDILGTIVFLLYLSIILSFLKKKFIFKLIHVESIILTCGILWEYVTPFYRKDTVSDPIDLFAYIFGGLLFWYVCDGDSLMNESTKISGQTN